ncbi:MAG: MucR family transcriptional regulator [Candidatus Rokubacteria bacterium]|nr:MucR family transcriptional regulator [Candidatus Rokubacteria bacterium]
MPRASARNRPPGPGGYRLAYYRANFLASLRPDGIVCLECGRVRKALGTHLRFRHGVTVDDYRERWGFNRQTTFIAASTAEKLRQVALKRKIGARGREGRALMVKARAARSVKSRAWRPEARLRASEAKKRLYASGWQPRRYMKVSEPALRKLVAKGYDLARIVRTTNLSRDQARTRLQQLGVLPPPRRRRVIDRTQILALRRQGLWPLEIARRIGAKPQAVRKILWQLRNQGVKIPTPGRPRPIKRRLMSDEDFLKAWRHGGRPVDVARRLGVSKQYVIYKTAYLRGRGLIPPVGSPRRRARPKR